MPRIEIGDETKLELERRRAELNRVYKGRVTFDDVVKDLLGLPVGSLGGDGLTPVSDTGGDGFWEL